MLFSIGNGTTAVAHGVVEKRPVLGPRLTGLGCGGTPLRKIVGQGCDTNVGVVVMQVEVEETGSCTRKVSVTIPADDVTTAFERVFREMSRSVQLPGFRRGRVPRSLVERRFREQAQSEVQNQLVEGSIGRAMSDHKVEVVSVSKVSYGDLAQGADFSYTADVEVRPDIVLQQVKGLRTIEMVVVVGDDEVRDQLDGLRERASQLVPVLDRDTVETGDVVQVDYVGTMGGVPLDGSEDANVMLEIGRDDAIPGLAEGLVGAKVPGQRRVQITLPGDYEDATLAGKDATFEVTLKELKKRDVPALDDDFAVDLGWENVAELEAHVRARLLEENEQRVKRQRRQTVLESLVAANPFEVPPSMVEDQKRHMHQMAMDRMHRLFGRHIPISAEERDALYERGADEARFEVATGLLMGEVAKTEEMEVSSSELDAAIESRIEDGGAQAERVRAHYEVPENRRALLFKLLEDKVVAFLLEHAQVVTIHQDPASDKATGEAGSSPDDTGLVSSGAVANAAESAADSAVTETEKEAVE